MNSLRVLVQIAAATFAVGCGAAERCLEVAAQEFGVEPNILDALRQHQAENKARNPTFAAREFGPMGVSDKLIQFAARKVNVDPEKAKADRCENYRVAAWFLGEVKQRNNGDIWEAVRQYYFGAKRIEAVEVRSSAYIKRIKELAATGPVV